MTAPVLLLDSREQWHPVGVEESIAPHGYRFTNATLERAGVVVDRLDLPPDLRQPDLPPVGYHRVAQGGGLHWHQYWTWWLYNPKKWAGFGAHEGDWELVQLGCTDPTGANPVLVTCSQHSGGEKREYWRAQLLDGTDHPKVYVARDSHANYFAACEDVTDTADGAGRVLQVQWRPFGAWAKWPGTWGNSDNSPGPLSTRRAWRAPHAYHGQARG